MERITEESRLKNIVRTHKYVFVDVYADWCVPCKKIVPYLEHLSEEYDNVMFVKFNCEELPELSNALSVKSLPTLLLFKEGKIVAKCQKANKDAIKEMFEKI